MKFSIFKRTQHKTFTHIPIYYNEKEEHIKDLEEEARVEKSEEKSTDYHETMKGSMRKFEHNHQSAVNFSSNQRKRSNVRIIVILSILFIMAYLLLNYTDTFIEVFVKH